MKRITCLVAAVAAFALAFCLVGCSDENSVTDGEATISEAELDRTVTVHGISYKVSSQWEEQTNDGTIETMEIGFNNYHDSDTSFTMSVWYDNYDLDETAEEAIKSDMENDSYSNVEYSEVDSSIVHGAKYTIYEYSYESSGYTFAGCTAYIMGSKMHYKIDVRSGSSSLANLNVILDTVYFP